VDALCLNCICLEGSEDKGLEGHSTKVEEEGYKMKHCKKLVWFLEKVFKISLSNVLSFMSGIVKWVLDYRNMQGWQVTEMHSLCG
jgi:hypothetical protein